MHSLLINITSHDVDQRRNACNVYMSCTPIIAFVYYLYNSDSEKMLDDFSRLYLYNHVHCFRDARLTLQLEKKNAKKKKHILKKKEFFFKIKIAHNYSRLLCFCEFLFTGHGCVLPW